MDKNQCRYMDSNGQVQNPTMQPCAEGISAVKAIAIAQQQGQKIYTITQANATTALSKLPIGGEVGVEIRNAINAGKEVTFHESRIHEHGWSGYGYSIVDPETGAGAYLIEGKGNGGWLDIAKTKILQIINLANDAYTLFGIFNDFFATFSNILDVINSENCGLGIKVQAIITFIGILMAREGVQNTISRWH